MLTGYSQINIDKNLEARALAFHRYDSDHYKRQWRQKRAPNEVSGGVQPSAYKTSHGPTMPIIVFIDTFDIINIKSERYFNIQNAERLQFANLFAN